MQGFLTSNNTKVSSLKALDFFFLSAKPDIDRKPFPRTHDGEDFALSAMLGGSGRLSK